ncbi:hypothetical protein YC2023_068350 [Brassica napus]
MYPDLGFSGESTTTETFVFGVAPAMKNQYEASGEGVAENDACKCGSDCKCDPCTYPEHSELTLEDLRVITKESVEVDDAKSYVRVTLTPTLPHCHVPHLIGLCIYAKLLKSLPTRFKVDVRVAPGSHATEAAGMTFQTALVKPVDVRVAPGSHATEAAVNKQLGDKERIAAALESPFFVALH